MEVNRRATLKRALPKGRSTVLGRNDSLGRVAKLFMNINEFSMTNNLYFITLSRILQTEISAECG